MRIIICYCIHNLSHIWAVICKKKYVSQFPRYARQAILIKLKNYNQRYNLSVPYEKRGPKRS